MQRDAVKAVAGDNARIFVVSSSAHKGLTEVLRALRDKVQAVRTAALEKEEFELDVDDDIETISLGENQIAEAWTVEKDSETGAFIVRGDKIEKFARRTNFDGFENVNRLRDIMNKMGINHELSRAGAVGDSVIRIGDSEFTLLEQ